jgi:hypothetical protein
MALYIGIGVGLLIVAFIAFVATRPTDYRVERSAVFCAPPSAVFPIINDLHQWSHWSPYDYRDPNMQKTYSGAAAGPGASYAWNGNGQVGEGRLTISDSQPNELVAMDLEFTRPFKCHNLVQFTMTPVEGGTRVSWIMDGKNTLVSKAMSLVMNMDKMIGSDFERGLSNLDKFVSGEPVAQPTASCPA